MLHGSIGSMDGGLVGTFRGPCVANRKQFIFDRQDTGGSVTYACILSQTCTCNVSEDVAAVLSLGVRCDYGTALMDGS